MFHFIAQNYGEIAKSLMSASFIAFAVWLLFSTR